MWHFPLWCLFQKQHCNPPHLPSQLHKRVKVRENFARAWQCHLHSKPHSNPNEISNARQTAPPINLYSWLQGKRQQQSARLYQQAKTHYLDWSNVYIVHYSDKHHYTESIMESTTSNGNSLIGGHYCYWHNWSHSVLSSTVCMHFKSASNDIFFFLVCGSRVYPTVDRTHWRKES